MGRSKKNKKKGRGSEDGAQGETAPAPAPAPVEMVSKEEAGKLFGEALNVMQSTTEEDVMVSLQGARVGDKRVKSIVKALENAQNLTVLDLSHNSISDQGADLLGEVLAAGAAPKLTLLNLTGNNISQDCRNRLTDILSPCKSLQLELMTEELPAPNLPEDCMPIASPEQIDVSTTMSMPDIISHLKRGTNESRCDALESAIQMINSEDTSVQDEVSGILGHVVRILRNPATPTNEVTTAVRTLGRARYLAACVVSRLTCLTPRAALDTRLFETKAVELCLTLGFQYSLASPLHAAMLDMAEAVINRGAASVLCGQLLAFSPADVIDVEWKSNLLKTTGIATGLAGIATEQQALHATNRVGYFGPVVALCILLHNNASKDSVLQETLSKEPAWCAFVSGELFAQQN